MIAAEELRIRNYVEVLDIEGNSKNEIIQVIAIDSEKEYQDLKGTISYWHYINGRKVWTNGRWLKYIVPVKLTEEWFRKLPEEEFEFVSFGDRLIWQHKKFRAIKYEFSADCCFVYFNDNMINIKLFVHEWQNIHKALTGEQLPI